MDRPEETATTASRRREPRHHERLVTIDATSELRWFVEGPLPVDVVEWFTGSGLEGLIEHRVDTYRLDGRDDLGVKRRSGRTLELKRRRSEQQLVQLDTDLAGWLESWQRWSPADARLSLTERDVWLDVEKLIVKRRFDATGVEQPLSASTRAMTGIGCDVEIAAVERRGRPSWTLAFAAFGPPSTRSSSIHACWAALAPGRPDEVASLRLEDSYGYPAWLVPEGAGASVPAGAS